MKLLTLIQPRLFPHVMERDSLWGLVQGTDCLSGRRTVQEDTLNEQEERDTSVHSSSLILDNSLMDFFSQKSLLSVRYSREEDLYSIKAFYLKIAGLFINQLCV